jgi:uncharacterized integral membrane protein (TIGR00698 family)
LKKIRGILFVLIIAILGEVLGRQVPTIGAGGFSILLGMLIANIFGIKKSFEEGINFSSKFILHFSIILLGLSINFHNVVKVGGKSLPIIILGITSSFVVANIVGKIMGLNSNTRNLIGAGTGICGGSAIAAISAVINPKEEEISYSLSIIFLFNLLAVFIFPILGHILHMTQQYFGVFAGSAINDTSSVVAAGYIYGNEAGKLATTVKLTRTLAIIPMVLFFSFKNKSSEKFSLRKSVPWFISGFVIMSFVRTGFDYFPQFEMAQNIMNVLNECGKFMITMAIGAIGLKTEFKSLKSSGIKPIIVGLCTWLAVICTTLFCIRFFGV